MKKLSLADGELKIKRLKIIKNPLTSSIDSHVYTSKKNNQNINSNFQNNLQMSNGNLINNGSSKLLTPSTRITKSTIKTDIPNINNINIFQNNISNKSGRLTFDAVFNKQESKKNNINQFIIPPIIIGNFQNQPQISININNYNINNYSSNKLKTSFNLSNNNINNQVIVKKKTEPVKITKPIRDESRNDSKAKIKLVKQELFIDDSISIAHSNSNILKPNRKVI